MRLFLLLVTAITFANSDYHDQVYLGESLDRQYSGPLSPAYEFLPDILRHQSKDDLYYEKQSINHALEFFDLFNFQVNEYDPALQCSNKLLSDNVNYIRYLFRLIALNYIYESINLAYLSSFSFGAKANSCNLNWKAEIKKCFPHKSDMKTYIARVEQVIPTQVDTSQLRVIKRNDIKKNIKSFVVDIKNLRNNQFSTVIGRSFCQNEGCTSFDSEKIKNIFNKSCDELKNQFITTCNEKDELFGISQADIVRKVLADSDIISFRNGELGECLQRYVKMFKVKEYYPKYLTSIFDSVYQKLNEDSSVRYIQGRIFVPGALKKFDEQGLSSFLFSPKKIAKESVKPKKKSKKIIPKKKKVLTTLNNTPTPKVVAKPELKKEKKKKKKLSGFEWSVREVYEFGKDLAYVSESRLKRDFRYDRETKGFLEEVLQPYQTRKVLADMKLYDKLGSLKEPIRLSFLKFLIDEEKHQALFNMIQTIGNQFYVINDIEGKQQPVLFEMRNSAKTKYKWEFLIIRPAF